MSAMCVCSLTTYSQKSLFHAHSLTQTHQRSHIVLNVIHMHQLSHIDTLISTLLVGFEVVGADFAVSDKLWQPPSLFDRNVICFGRMHYTDIIRSQLQTDSELTYPHAADILPPLTALHSVPDNHHSNDKQVTTTTNNRHHESCMTATTAPSIEEDGDVVRLLVRRFHKKTSERAEQPIVEGDAVKRMEGGEEMDGVEGQVEGVGSSTSGGGGCGGLFILVDKNLGDSVSSTAIRNVARKSGEDVRAAYEAMSRRGWISDEVGEMLTMWNWKPKSRL
eukprot:GHVQ01040905.1.p1 GENE.GHVQ01040905.1~~GHVQ01040905.1.p1  ORF type:complete len:277 (+),score=49.30 GHVQ01040905.1:700-1530(+)